MIQIDHAYGNYTPACKYVNAFCQNIRVCERVLKRSDADYASTLCSEGLSLRVRMDAALRSPPQGRFHHTPIALSATGNSSNHTASK